MGMKKRSKAALPTTSNKAMMTLLFQPVNRDHVDAILRWEYEPPYRIYNMGAGIETQAELDEAVAYFLNPEYAFQAILAAESMELVAFCSFGLDGQVPGGDYRQTALDIGLGVRPDLTGRGLGTEFVGAVIDFALDTYHPPQLRVTIAEFNGRARRVWQKHGFQKQQTFEHRSTGMRFQVMSLAVNVDVGERP